MKKGTVKIGTTGMDYAIFGQGKKTLVMIFGMNLIKSTPYAEEIKRQYNLLLDDFTIYLFDRKDDFCEGYSIEDMAEDTVYAMKELGLGRSCIFGTSQGGMIAQTIALKYPELVERLALASTYARPDSHSIEDLDVWKRLALAHNLDELIPAIMYRCCSKKVVDDSNLIEAYRQLDISDYDMEKFAALADACMNFDVYDRLPEIKALTHVFAGSEDGLHFCDDACELAQKLGCGLTVYEGGSHDFYDEIPQFITDLNNFFAL